EAAIGYPTANLTNPPVPGGVVFQISPAAFARRVSNSAAPPAPVLPVAPVSSAQSGRAVNAARQQLTDACFQALACGIMDGMDFILTPVFRRHAFGDLLDY